MAPLLVSAIWRSNAATAARWRQKSELYRVGWRSKTRSNHDTWTTRSIMILFLIVFGIFRHKILYRGAVKYFCRHNFRHFLSWVIRQGFFYDFLVLVKVCFLQVGCDDSTKLLNHRNKVLWKYSKWTKLKEDRHYDTEYTVLIFSLVLVNFVDTKFFNRNNVSESQNTSSLL